MIKIINKKKYLDLIEELKELKMTQSDDERIIASKNIKISNLESKVTALTKENTILENKNNEINDEYHRLMQISDSYIFKMEDMATKKKSLSSKIGGLTKEINKLKALITKQEEIINNFKEDAKKRNKKNPIDYIFNHKKAMENDKERAIKEESKELD